MVQYGELMHFCYIWLRKIMGADFPGLELKTTRHAEELTANQTAERGLAHFTEGLVAVFGRWAKALKPGGPLAFTYHHNRQDAYLAVGVAVLDAGLICSASLPCPAEMGGSIHIHGTGSSILDTVFVCRDHGHTRREWLFNGAKGLATILEREFQELRSAGLRPTTGDIRCAAYGHITRMAIWRLRSSWNNNIATETKLSVFRDAMNLLAKVDDVIRLLDKAQIAQERNRRLALTEAN
jgi:adenine-specific DNA methylase